MMSYGYGLVHDRSVFVSWPIPAAPPFLPNFADDLVSLDGVVEVGLESRVVQSSDDLRGLRGARWNVFLLSSTQRSGQKGQAACTLSYQYHACTCFDRAPSGCTVKSTPRASKAEGLGSNPGRVRRYLLLSRRRGDAILPHRTHGIL